jgi:hypothetical protein
VDDESSFLSSVFQAVAKQDTFSAFTILYLLFRQVLLFVSFKLDQGFLEQEHSDSQTKTVPHSHLLSTIPNFFSFHLCRPMEARVLCDNNGHYAALSFIHEILELLLAKAWSRP